MERKLSESDSCLTMQGQKGKRAIFYIKCMCDCQSTWNIDLKNLITSTIGSVAASVPFLVRFAGPLGPQVINVTNNTNVTVSGSCFEFSLLFPAVTILLLPMLVSLLQLSHLQLLMRAILRLCSMSPPPGAPVLGHHTSKWLSSGSRLATSPILSNACLLCAATMKDWTS